MTRHDADEEEFSQQIRLLKDELKQVQDAHTKLKELALKLCRELQSPAMEYLNEHVQTAWSELYDVIQPNLKTGQGKYDPLLPRRGGAGDEVSPALPETL